jgi:hypothetical protein
MRNKNNAKRLPDDRNKEMEKIIDGLKCPKDFIFVINQDLKIFAELKTSN